MHIAIFKYYSNISLTFKVVLEFMNTPTLLFQGYARNKQTWSSSKFWNDPSEEGFKSTFVKFITRNQQSGLYFCKSKPTFIYIQQLSTCPQSRAGKVIPPSKKALEAFSAAICGNVFQEINKNKANLWKNLAVSYDILVSKVCPKFSNYQHSGWEKITVF